MRAMQTSPTIRANLLDTLKIYANNIKKMPLTLYCARVKSQNVSSFHENEFKNIEKKLNHFIFHQFRVISILKHNKKKFFSCLEIFYFWRKH